MAEIDEAPSLLLSEQPGTEHGAVEDGFPVAEPCFGRVLEEIMWLEYHALLAYSLLVGCGRVLLSNAP
jgi:hypothetical protein